MKAKVLIGLIVSAVILTTGCSLDSYPSYTPPVDYTHAQMQADAKILGALIVIDRSTIAAASLAERKASNPAVRDYAASLFREQNTELEEIQRLSRTINIEPVHGEIARTLKRKDKKMLADLYRVLNRAFDKAYIADMIKEHSTALNLLDHNLIPTSVNPIVKTQLEQTRAHLSMHLQRAKEIEAGL